VTLEERLRPLEMAGVEEQRLLALEEGAAHAVPERVADGVAEHRGDEAAGSEQADVERAL